MPRITGLLETALYVSDLFRAVRFYQDLFDFPQLLGDDRLVGLGVPGRHVLLLFQESGSTQGEQTPGGFIPPHDGHGQLHLAFAISEEDVEPWVQRLEQAGIALESRVKPPRGGTSLYFRDPDNHLIELASPGLWTIY